MIFQNIHPQSFLLGVNIIREHEVRIMQRERLPDIRRLGFIIKDVISIIMNIGLTIV